MIKYILIPLFTLLFIGCTNKVDTSNLEKIAQMQKMLEEKDTKINELESQLEKKSSESIQTEEKTKQVLVKEATIVNGEKVPAVYKIIPIK